MKPVIRLLPVFVFLNLLLPSCGVSVVKRQHMNGYYISTNSHKHSVDRNELAVPLKDAAIVDNPSETAEIRETVTSPTKVASETAIVTEKTIITPDKTVRKSSEIPAKESGAVSRTERTPLKTTLTDRLPMTKKMGTTLKKMQSASGARDGDGLSLFWIVILVLLILWAAGLLGGGWGLGGLINILLVIALVLLILWLLRVI